MLQVIKHCLVKSLKVAAAGIFLLSCSNRTELEEIRIGRTGWPGYAYLNLAVEKGFFEEEGVSVDIKTYPNISSLQEDFSAGKLHGMTGSLSEILLTGEKYSRRPQVFLAVDYSDGADVILANSEITDVSELKGKKVAVERGSHEIYLLQRALEKAGLSLADITLVYMSPSEIEHALLVDNSSGLDAAVIYPPLSLRVLKNPNYKKLFSSKEIPGEMVDVVALERSLIKPNRKKVEAFVRGFNRAVLFADNYPEKAVSLMAKIEGISEEELLSELKGLEILSLCEQKELFSPSGPLTEALKTSDRILRRLGEVSQAEQLIGAVTFGPVQAAAVDC